MSYDPEDSIEHDAYERLAYELTLKRLKQHYNTLSYIGHWAIRGIKEYDNLELDALWQNILAGDDLPVDSPLLEAYCRLMCSRCDEAQTFRQELFEYLAFHKPMYSLADAEIQQRKGDDLITQYQQRNEP